MGIEPTTFLLRCSKPVNCDTCGMDGVPQRHYSDAGLLCSRAPDSCGCLFPPPSSHQRVLLPPPCVQQYRAAFANGTLFPRASLGFVSNWFGLDTRDTRRAALPRPAPPTPCEVRRRVLSRSADPALLSFITARVFAFSINCRDHVQRLQKQPPALCWRDP